MKAEKNVKTSSGTYPVVIGDSLLKKSLVGFQTTYGHNECFAFVDENVWNHHKKYLETVFKQLDIDAKFRIIPSGEKSKSLREWSASIDYLLANGVRRNTPLLAIGGGVTGDVAGYVAASTLRGIPLIQIPTTLLAMVDSAIGGKTGINHSTGKNLIGAFYQPDKVIADLSFLETLPDREWYNGLSEILKYGAIENADILESAEIFLEQSPPLTDHQKLTRLIEACVTVKADIVAKDEFEAGTRAYLNFGHTFAHALEKAADFDVLSHGEAVFLGMLAALDLSNRWGNSSMADTPIRKFRHLYSFKLSANDLKTEQLMKFMKSDKKVIGKDLRFILLQDWQQPAVITISDQSMIRESWLTIFNEL